MCKCTPELRVPVCPKCHAATPTKKVFDIETVTDAYGSLVKYEVIPYLVLREGIKEGCTLPTVTLRDQHHWQSHQLKDYYATQAWR